MLGPFRKFSQSFYAKILIGIIIIPFVFWGMGSNFVGGNKNVIVVIEKEKYSVQSFFNFIQRFVPPDQKIEERQIENLLTAFIGEKLMEKEIEEFGIKLSNQSLSDLIKIQKNFQRDNKFSRVEYEKFLLQNNHSAAAFEANFHENEKRKQLLDFISGGIMPSKYLINKTYDKINQKRNIELINLNDVFKKEIKFSEDEINSYFLDNKKKYIETYKTIKLVELSPKKLISSEEFNDTFFKKVDEIDYMIIEGRSFDDIIKKFNLEGVKTHMINGSGKDLNLNEIPNVTKKFTDTIFNFSDFDSTSLVESEDKYFIVEILKTEQVQREIENANVKKDILLNLGIAVKRKLMSNIISRINKNNFTKSDFDKLAKDENIQIQNIVLENQNDDKVLKNEIVSHVYSAAEKRVIVVNDINFAENFLVYVKKVTNAEIKEKTKDYQKYLNLAKIEIVNDIYNTYDRYIRERYKKIDINDQALDLVKNRFN